MTLKSLSFLNGAFSSGQAKPLQLSISSYLQGHCAGVSIEHVQGFAPVGSLLS
jgi:hypothetical protein